MFEQLVNYLLNVENREESFEAFIIDLKKFFFEENKDLETHNAQKFILLVLLTSNQHQKHCVALFENIPTEALILLTNLFKEPPELVTFLRAFPDLTTPLKVALQHKIRAQGIPKYNLMLEFADALAKEEITQGICIAFQMVFENSNFYREADFEGFSAMYLAAEMGASRLVEVLLNFGFKANVPCRVADKGITALYVATTNGHADVVRLLIERGKVNFHTPLETGTCAGMKVLYEAIAANEIPVIQVLLDAGVQLNEDVSHEAASYGFSPLYYAIWCSNSTAHTIRFLLQAGAEATAPNKSGKNKGLTPAFQAAFTGNEDKMRALLEVGKGNLNAPIQHKNGKNKSGDFLPYEGVTPLFMAAANGFQSVVSLMAEIGKYDLGAPLETGYAKGFKPIHVASFCQRPGVLEYLLSQNFSPVADDPRKSKPLTRLHYLSDRSIDAISADRTRCKLLIMEELETERVTLENLSALLNYPLRWFVSEGGRVYVVFPANYFLASVLQKTLPPESILPIANGIASSFCLLRNDAKKLVEALNSKLGDIKKRLEDFKAWEIEVRTQLKPYLETAPEIILDDNDEPKIILDHNDDSHAIFIRESGLSFLTRAIMTALSDDLLPRCQASLKLLKTAKSALASIIPSEQCYVKDNTVILSSFTPRNQSMLTTFLEKSQAKHIGENEVHIAFERWLTFGEAYFLTLKTEIKRCNEKIEALSREHGKSRYEADRSVLVFRTFEIKCTLEDISTFSVSTPQPETSPAAPVSVAVQPRKKAPGIPAKKDSVPRKPEISVKEDSHAVIEIGNRILSLHSGKCESLCKRIKTYYENILKLPHCEKEITGLSELLTKVKLLENALAEFKKDFQKLSNLLSRKWDEESARNLCRNIRKKCQEILQHKDVLEEQFKSLPHEDDLVKPVAAAACVEKPLLTETPVAVSHSGVSLFSQRKNAPPSERLATDEVNSLIPGAIRLKTRAELEGHSTAATPKKPRPKSASPTLQNATELLVGGHLDHIRSLLLEENTRFSDTEGKRILCHALYYHCLQILVALSADTDDGPRPVAKALLENLSHRYHIAFGDNDPLIDFCKEFSEVNALTEENLKNSVLYKSFEKKFKINVSRRIDNIKTALNILKICHGKCTDQIKPLSDIEQTPYLNASQTALKIMGECDARLFEQSRFHKAFVIWHNFKSGNFSFGEDDMKCLKSDCTFLIKKIDYFKDFVDEGRLTRLTKTILPEVIQCIEAGNMNQLAKKIKALVTTLSRCKNEDFLQHLDVVQFLEEARKDFRNPTKHPMEAQAAHRDYAPHGLKVDVDTVDIPALKNMMSKANKIRLNNYLVLLRESAGVKAAPTTPSLSPKA